MYVIFVSIIHSTSIPLQNVWFENFSPHCDKTRASCSVYEIVSAICILFVFGQIVLQIILIQPNSKIYYTVQA